ncbi:hypothetical protein [Cellulomonas sp.]|uniref:hypothetical protein n=1 Tax=Cellulomonas sp. TaxID=40001 RepID=UPI0025C33904|nr:hypothetical protein [Cellulomonas sp.]
MTPAAFFSQTVVASTAVTSGEGGSSSSPAGPAAGVATRGGRGSDDSCRARSSVRGPEGTELRPVDDAGSALLRASTVYVGGAAPSAPPIDDHELPPGTSCSAACTEPP